LLKVVGEQVSIQRCTHEYDLQVRSQREKVSQNKEEEITEN